MLRTTYKINAQLFCGGSGDRGGYFWKSFVYADDEKERK